MQPHRQIRNSSNPVDSYSRVIIAGCGYTGLRTARLWRESGYQVTGIVRSSESVSTLKNHEIFPVQSDLEESGTLPSLETAGSLVYYFVPPPRQEKDTWVRHFLSSIQDSASPRRLIYISTSGVYGITAGGWVDETTPPNPATTRAKRRMDAENFLRTWTEGQNTELLILRVPGIYGPHRIPIQRVRSGAPVLSRAEAPYSNRIHVDDLARICYAAGLHGSRTVYPISDDHPSKVTDYYNELADLLDVPHPPTISMVEAEQSMSPMRLSFLRESRRIDNSTMIRELQVTLQYPSYREGLCASLREMGIEPHIEQ